MKWVVNLSTGDAVTVQCSGIEASKDAGGVLPPGKVFIARLEVYKDLS